MVPQRAEPRLIVADARDERVRVRSQPHIQTQRRRQVADTRPDGLRLTVFVGKQRSAPPLGIRGVDKAAVRIEVSIDNNVQNRPDPVVGQVAPDPRRAQEPLSVELVGHQGLVLLIAGAPQIVVFAVPQARFERRKALFKLAAPVLRAGGVARLVRDPGGGLQSGEPQDRDIHRRAGKVPRVVGIPLCIPVGEAVAVRVQRADRIHRADHVRPHRPEIIGVSGIQVIAQYHQHELVVHVHAVKAVVHVVQIRREEVVHAPVLALEGGAHAHLAQLQRREQRQQAERRVVGDVRRVEAAEALPLPQAEFAVLQIPGALDEGAQVPAPAVRIYFGQAGVIEQLREGGGPVENLRAMVAQEGVRVRGAAEKILIEMPEPPAVL